MATQSATATALEYDLVNYMVTEDDEPVDNMFSAKQQRLLVEPIYSSWKPAPKEDSPTQPRIFLADVNVGVFHTTNRPPLVPDFFLSLDVQPHEDWHSKQHRSYFVFTFGKPPEVVVEIVSNREGNELGSKLRDYAMMGVDYYVVFDPEKLLSEDTLRVYEPGLWKRYHLREDYKLPEVGLNLTLWKGSFEGVEDTWLRWCDAEGNLILTGQERADQESIARQKAEAELAELRAEVERLRQK